MKYLNIKFFEKVSSTNDIAKENLLEPEFTIFVADYQTKGRGRHKREWFSPKGENLYFSFILKPKAPLRFMSPVPIIAGLSVFQTLKAEIDNIKIKWPNDVVVDGKKISGILVESFKNCLIVGVGVNVNTEKFPDFKENTPTSIFIETKKREDRLKILGEFMRCFENNYTMLLKELKIPETLLEEINSNLFLKGEKVAVIFKDSRIEGTIEGVKENGALIVDGKEIIAGEVKKLLPT